MRRPGTAVISGATESQKRKLASLHNLLTVIFKLLALALSLTACTLSGPLVTLETKGYGYEIGDLVEIRMGEPALNDIVVYDPFKNESMCGAFGPAMALGKVVGLPGDALSFQAGGLSIRGQIVKLDSDYGEQRAVFGGQKYQTLVSSETITLQPGEYLADKWVGQTCFPGELDTTGSSVVYNRFTINQAAITGIIVKKVGHDDQAEERIKNTVY